MTQLRQVLCWGPNDSLTLSKSTAFGDRVQFEFARSLAPFPLSLPLLRTPRTRSAVAVINDLAGCLKWRPHIDSAASDPLVGSLVRALLGRRDAGRRRLALLESPPRTANAGAAWERTCSLRPCGRIPQLLGRLLLLHACPVLGLLAVCLCYAKHNTARPCLRVISPLFSAVSQPLSDFPVVCACVRVCVRVRACAYVCVCLPTYVSWCANRAMQRAKRTAQLCAARTAYGDQWFTLALIKTREEGGK